MNSTTALLFVVALTIAQSKSVAQDDIEASWRHAIQRILTLPAYSDERIDITKTLMERVRSDAHFRELVRQKLRSEQSEEARVVAAMSFLSAPGAVTSDDCLYMWSLPETRIMAKTHTGTHGLQEMFHCFPMLLYSDDPLIRLSGLRSIERFYRERGLPYYAMLLNDSHDDVAVAAARAFRLCRKENASSHLLTYLAKNGQKKKHKEVVRRVLETLRILYVESSDVPSSQKEDVRRWIQRLRTEGYEVQQRDKDTMSKWRSPTT